MGETATGRVLWHNFNVENKNPKAVEIGLQQLKGFLLAAGNESDEVKDVRELEGLSATAHVKIQADPTGVYGDKNVISYFKAWDGAKKTKSKKEAATVGFDADEKLPF